MFKMLISKLVRAESNLGCFINKKINCFCSPIVKKTVSLIEIINGHVGVEADDETTTVPVRARDPFVILKFNKEEICSKIS